MSLPDIADGNPLVGTASWIRSRGVGVAPWPLPPDAALTALDRPLLYLVEPDADPPDDLDDLVDWVRLPAAADEVIARATTLLAKARGRGTVLVTVDADGVLRVGERTVVLILLEARLLRALLASAGQVVSHATLRAVAWPEDAPRDPSALNHRVALLRRRVAHVPLLIHAVRGRGFMVEPRAQSRRAGADAHRVATAR